jgi:glycine/D-amino acid oxidase-like deaminating enzyme
MPQMNDATHGLWGRTAGPAPVTAALVGAVQADVGIVGAGYTGLSAALHLAEAGRSVVVLEADQIGFGGAGRNVGLVNAGMWVQPEALVARLGDHGHRLIDLLGKGPRQVFDLVARLGIACEAVPQGTLHLGVGAEGVTELQERARQWQRLGAAVELLSAGETAKRVGSAAYAGSLLDHRAGTIQPLAYARGLARAAMAMGVRIYSQSPVMSLHHTTEWQAQTPQGQVKAGWLIMATDAYTAHIHPELRQEQILLPYFNFATQPMTPAQQESVLPGLEGAWDTRQILTSFRRDAAGRLVFGSVGALRGTGRAVHEAWARRAMTRLFPQLKGLGFDHAWYGRIGMTADSLPRFHQLGPQAYSFSGYNGRGIAPGTVFGQCLAALVLGQAAEADMPLPLTPTAPIPLRGPREIFYELGAQVSHLLGARHTAK